MDNRTDPGVPGGKAYYPTTIWSEIRKAGCKDSASATTCLNGLLEKYYVPLLRHVRFKFGVSEHDGRDYIQDFIARNILVGELLSRASPQHGKFRCLLLTALNNFVKGELRKQNAQARRPVNGFITLDEIEYLAAGSSDEQNERFAVDWARAVLGETLLRMEQECKKNGYEARWGIFKERLLDPILNGTKAPLVQEMVTKFGFASATQAYNAISTAKEQFVRLRRKVVEEYAETPADVEKEICELHRVVSGAKENAPLEEWLARGEPEKAKRISRRKA